MTDIVLILVVVDLFVSVVTLIVVIATRTRKKVDKPKSKYTLQAMFGRKNYSKMLDDCKGDCDTCPFKTCLVDDCDYGKRAIKNNDSEISIWLKPEYKQR